MQFFDATTLLLVNAVFNALAALAWALLAGVFKVAPRACWVLAAAHLSRIAALRCYECRLLSPLQRLPWLPELFGVLTLALLCLGVQRLLRLQADSRPVLLIAGTGMLAVLGIGLAGRTSGMLIAGSLTGFVLALLICRDILVGARPTMAARWVLPLSLPYLALAAALVWRGLRVLGGAEQVTPALMMWLWLLLSLASSVSLIALVVHRLIGRISQLSLHDPLTGALNRRAINRGLQRLQALRQRGHPYCVLLLDIDHFKAINDKHGHAGGDAALVHTVQVLRQGLRGQDELGRLGGEEFCVLLPYTELPAAAEVAERLRAHLASHACPWKAGKIAFTASFGAAQASSDELRSDAVLMQADRQLYRAKSSGRNRVCVEGEDETEGRDPPPSQPPGA